MTPNSTTVRRPLEEAIAILDGLDDERANQARAKIREAMASMSVRLNDALEQLVRDAKGVSILLTATAAYMEGEGNRADHMFLLADSIWNDVQAIEAAQEGKEAQS